MTANALRLRLADIFNVDAAELLAVRGALHAKELFMRLVTRGDARTIDYPPCDDLDRLAAIYRLERASGADAAIRRFDDAPAPTAALLMIDETGVEYADRDVDARPSGAVAILRDLEGVFLPPGAPLAAVIAAPGLIARFQSVIEPNAMPPALAKIALDALAPHRLLAARARIDSIRKERARLVERLAEARKVASVAACERALIRIAARNGDKAAAAFRSLDIAVSRTADGAFLVPVGAPAENARLLAAFDIFERPPRMGSARRDTLETRIAALVDLDREGAIGIATGVGFFDHMLTQIAHHAGISLTLACDGDLEVDAHHTIEDCAIALGQALSAALGDRRGVARFGFTLPMDEAEASVSVDLGGRPYLVFDGEFSAPLIGAYPTEMTEHVFRSLAQSLGAAIHLRVTGVNDHHKTEACYKAFGRALRQAVRIEGDGSPSTKGVL